MQSKLSETDAPPALDPSQALQAAQCPVEHAERTTHDLRRLIEQSPPAAYPSRNEGELSGAPQARLSAELRTHAQVILHTASALLGRELATEHRHCIETIRSSGEALLATLEAARPVGKAPSPVYGMPAARASRILLVEDNPINQDDALLMLDRLGYRADVASDGRAALQLLESETYDLILMDVFMPEMNGLEATSRLRAGGGHASRVPVVALVAGVQASDCHACLNAGMTDCLTKPIREPELAAKLLRYLSSKTAAGEASPLAC